MNNNYHGQNNPGFGEQQNPGFGESANTQQNANPGESSNSAPGGNTQQNGYSAPNGGQNYYYQTPIDPDSVTPPASGKDYGATSQTLGIIGLVASFVCSCLPIVGLVLGIFAVVYGKRAAKEAGQDKDAGTAGRICGIIAIVLSAIAILTNIVAYILLLSGAMDGFWGEYYRQLETAMGMAR